MILTFTFYYVVYDQFVVGEQHELDGKKLSSDAVWEHPLDCGLRIKNLPPGVTKDILEIYFEGHDVATKRILVAPDGQSATVELTDTLSEYDVC